MATITKTGKSSWRVRKQHKNKSYSLILDYKPTKTEAEMLILDEIRNKAPCKHDMSFEDAFNAYIEMKSEILSPSTIRGYTYRFRRIPKSFKNMRIRDIDDVDVQRLINTYARDHAPKSVRNLSGLISAVIKSQRPKADFDIALPQNVRPKYYIPSDEDVKAILEECRGTNKEVPIMLATLGLRRSEIFALTIDDVNFDEGTIRINKAKVLDAHNNLVIKNTTKTVESNRTISAPAYLLKRIKEQGKVIDVRAQAVTQFLYRTQDKLGIPRFSMHKLRHYFASSAHSLGIPDQYIMSLGGWKTDHVMKNVYRHAQEEATKKNADKYLSHLHSLTGINHDNNHDNFHDNF